LAWREGNSDNVLTKMDECEDNFEKKKLLNYKEFFEKVDKL